MPEPREIKVRSTAGSEIRVSSLPLLFDLAHSMIPFIAEVLAIASGDLSALVAGGQLNPKASVSDPAVLMAVFPALRNVAAFLGAEGRLDKYSPKILSTTKVALPSSSDGELEWYELAKTKDRSYVFDAHPEIYLPTLYHAGSTTFARFFPARAPRGSASPTP